MIVDKLRKLLQPFRKIDLRDVCREKYGDDFAKKYDMVNAGIPIGNIEETKAFLALVEATKEET